MTSLFNPISKCFVVSKHGIFITYPTNYDVIILQRFCQEIEETRVANIYYIKACIFIDLHLSVSTLKKNLYLQYLFIATVRKCVICRVHCNLYEFSFTKISKFPTVAFLRYSISNEFCLV